MWAGQERLWPRASIQCWLLTRSMVRYLCLMQWHASACTHLTTEKGLQGLQILPIAQPLYFQGHVVLGMKCGVQ